MSDLVKLHSMYDMVAKAYAEASKMPRATRQNRNERLKNLRYWKERMNWLDKQLAEQGEQ